MIKQASVPSVRTEAVTTSGSVIHVTLPGTTSAFDAANIYARASGYINRCYVDIGSRVKAGQTLVEITAPELDDQIAQAEATLVQTQASLRQIGANRELARQRVFVGDRTFAHQHSEEFRVHAHWPGGDATGLPKALLHRTTLLTPMLNRFAASAAA